MSRTSRIVCRVAIRRIADRRARLEIRTLPMSVAPFTDEERRIFRSIDRRGKPLR